MDGKKERRDGRLGRRGGRKGRRGGRIWIGGQALTILFISSKALERRM
jgi:hypothetical protein